jgi:EpsI family protein
MPKKSNPLSFLNSTAARIVTIVLVAHCVILYAVSRPEVVPSAAPLSSFPTNIQNWRMVQEGYVDEETREVLKADDLMTRMYARPGDITATNLFIAAFRSQRTGKAPHSPKNCLPGAGWMQEKEGTVTINVPGTGPIVTNRYIVSKGDSRSAVLYWYQSRDRVIASEYRAKFFAVADSMRFNRTDTALVRVVAPIVNGNDDAGVKMATDLVEAIFPTLHNFLPL